MKSGNLECMILILSLRLLSVHEAENLNYVQYNLRELMSFCSDEKSL